MSEEIKTLTHVVQICPLCTGQHDVLLRVRASTPGRLLFGGSGNAALTALCPISGREFPILPRLPEGAELVEVVGTPSHENAVKVGVAAAEGDGIHAEYADWVKSSRATALDFGKAMLTTSSGAIGIYFAVVKYLGSERVDDTLFGWFSVAPPVLFLASAAMFAWGLRPRLAVVAQEGFYVFRDERMRQLNRSSTAGLACFVAGLALTLVVLGLALNLS